MAETIAPIRYYNRLSGNYEKEAIYGERSLRWAYYNPLGKLVLKLLVGQPFFSRWYGWLMDRPSSRKKIIPFIDRYGLEVGEFLHSPESFPHFNAFLYREMKRRARPVDEDPSSLVFPADARHRAYEEVQKGNLVYAKGQGFDLAELLGDAELAEELDGGAILISRLCPVDCHRFQSPVACIAGGPRPIEGSLFSVNPLALAQNYRYLTRNRRWVIEMKLDSERRWALVVIGATCVGSVEFTYRPGRLEKGSELGYFRFGGSCLITLMPKGMALFDEDLLRESQKGIESYDQMGRVFGVKRAKARELGIRGEKGTKAQSGEKEGSGGVME
ncbi:MAG: phosphatidylserine decarboxylase [Opitutae bacterium]|nr:phosphatidylserine decarboxylase [Opitutae bacterium]